MPRALSLMLVLLLGCSAPPPLGSFGPTAGTRDRFLPEATAPPPTELLAAFEPPANLPYALGPGDKLHVEVWGQADLSGDHTVGPDGAITVPTYGTLPCAGLTREQAAQAITDALAGLYRHVSVTVRVDEYLSNTVTVLGSVANPGVYPFERTPTLLGALSRAGGLAPLDTELVPNRASIVRGADQVVWVDLRELLRNGNTSLDMRLFPGDVVYVEESTDALVYVLGEVHRPGLKRFDADMTLSDALGRAGGYTEDAQPKKMAIIRPADGTQTQINYKEYLEGNYELNVAMAEGDILYVPRSGLATFGYVLTQLSPFSSAVTFSTPE